MAWSRVLGCRQFYILIFHENLLFHYKCYILITQKCYILIQEWNYVININTKHLFPKPLTSTPTCYSFAALTSFCSLKIFKFMQLCSYWALLSFTVFSNCTKWLNVEIVCTQKWIEDVLEPNKTLFLCFSLYVYAFYDRLRKQSLQCKIGFCWLRTFQISTVSTLFSICSEFCVKIGHLCVLSCRWVTCRSGCKRFWKSALLILNPQCVLSSGIKAKANTGLSRGHAHSFSMIYICIHINHIVINSNLHV